MNNCFALVLIRNDLRLEDHPALYAASIKSMPVLPLYIFDKEASFGKAQDFWLNSSLQKLPFWIQKGDVKTILIQVIQQKKPSLIFATRGRTPHEKTSDEIIEGLASHYKIPLEFHEPNYLVNPLDLLTKEGRPIKVFSHFAKHFFKELQVKKPLPKAEFLPYPHPLQNDLISLSTHSNLSQYWSPGEGEAKKLLNHFLKTHLIYYERDSDFPSLDATSHLSPYLHFGEISVRSLFYELDTHPENKFLLELLWREFASYLLFHFPNLPNTPFDTRFNRFHWSENSHHLKLWQTGHTGVPIVDAAMLCLLETGWMHNRLRMIVSSFLTKDLLIDWREGAKWFEEHLVDADLASNRVNWQSVSGSGVDPAPYFRIFNPYLQSKKFDPRGEFIKSYLPKLHHLSHKEIHAPHLLLQESLERAHVLLGKTYPRPIVDHERARKIALLRFQALSS